MSLLLDTHTFAWFCQKDGLPAPVRTLIEDHSEDVFVSAISAYEMALKFRLGLWPDAGPLVKSFDSIIEEAHFRLLPVTSTHAIRAGLLATIHRDPFDRILAAQAMIEDLRIVSRDKQFELLGAARVWE
ncbi:MAG: type II toxin-antitoxin system VapC family toxin [Rhizobiaceae bacterium]|nr:type II toxin-antitoxin system VapC family toxin [Rhizobiaceae bacterium]